MDTNDKKNYREYVPYIVYESTISNMERHIKRLWILLIVSLLALTGCIFTIGRYCKNQKNTSPSVTYEAEETTTSALRCKETKGSYEAKRKRYG